jgi:hypothetical protein
LKTAGAVLRLIPLHKVIQHIIEDEKFGPLLHFEHDSSACGEFWAHQHMESATLIAKDIAAGQHYKSKKVLALTFVA